MAQIRILTKKGNLIKIEIPDAGEMMFTDIKSVSHFDEEDTGIMLYHEKGAEEVARRNMEISSIPYGFNDMDEVSVYLRKVEAILERD